MRLKLLIIILLFTSCDDLFDYSPYVIDFNDDNRGVHAKHIEELMENPAGNILTVALISDSHRNYDELTDFVARVNELPEVDLIIHAGDFTDFGLPIQYEWSNGILLKSDKPFFMVIGNHDLVGNGGEAYGEMYGAMNFHFIYGRIKFIFINTNSREYKFNGHVPDMGWLRNELKPADEFEKAIVVFHVPPFDIDFDRNLENDFQSALSMHGNVLLAVHGHIHSLDTITPYYNGIPYINVYGVRQRKFHLIHITENEFDHETVDY